MTASASMRFPGAAALASFAALAALTLVFPGSVRAAPGTVRTGSASGDSLADAAVERLQNRQTGVSLSGQAVSGFQRASLSGDSVRLGQPTADNAAFTQAEIDLRARPSAHTRGRLLFRLHQDWSNYYEEGPDPLIARWFDFTGELADDHIRYAVGDYRAKHTALTLNAPEPELLYEPGIFADRRQAAMGEFFLGDNRLPLQGLNLGYAQDSLAGDKLGLSSDIALARLRNVHSGGTSFLHWTDDVEKLSASSSWKATWLGAATLGFAQTWVYDDVAASRARNNTFALAQRRLLPQSLYEDNQVNAFSLDLDAGRWLSRSKVAVSLENEYAFSGYQSRVDDTAGYDVHLKDVDDRDGTALRSVFKAGYGKASEDPFSFALKLAYLDNGKDFVSDLAQSPTFVGRRILNSRTEVGGPNARSAPGLGGYNTLDALYNHRYTVDPITGINNSEFWYVDTKSYNGTNNWFRAPFLKNSYGFYTTTKTERDALREGGALDPHVQLLFPFGPATPNRTGITLDLNASALSGALEATALFASLQEPEGEPMDSLTSVAADYSRLGGGLKVRIGQLAHLARPLEVSGSYLQEGRKRGAFTSRGVSVGAEDFKTAMINADLHAAIWKGLSLLAGYQLIQSNPSVNPVATAASRSAAEGDLAQSQWALGLECRITSGAFVTAQYGRMGFEEKTTATEFDQDITSLTLLIAY